MWGFIRRSLKTNRWPWANIFHPSGVFVSLTYSSHPFSLYCCIQVVAKKVWLWIHTIISDFTLDIGTLCFLSCSLGDNKAEQKSLQIIPAPQIPHLSTSFSIVTTDVCFCLFKLYGLEFRILKWYLLLVCSGKSSHSIRGRY